MDSTEDGDAMYEEFVKEVATATGVSISQLEAELEPFT